MTPDRAVKTTAAVIVVGASVYLAPLEYEAGQWLGLPWWQAWSITAVVEGLLVLAILTGRAMWPALTLTWVSAALGQGHAAGVLTARPDWTRATTSALVVTAIVASLALTHRTLRARATERARAARLEAERAAERARAATERAQAEQRARDEQAERARLTQAATARAEHERALELERARAYANAETARLEAERERAAREHELALATLTTTPAAPRARAPKDDLQAARADRLAATWAERRGTDNPLTAADVAAELGCTLGAARDRIRRWERKTPAPTAKEATR